MSRVLRLTSLVSILLVVGLAGWRLLATGMADHLATDKPQAALGWDAGQTQARLLLAQQALATGQLALATDTTREALAREPLAAEAMALLGRIAEARGDADTLGPLYARLLARMPRDQYVRAWVAGDQLQKGHYAAALANITTLIRIAPPREQILVPIMSQMAQQEPAFVEALIQALGQNPPWREALLAELLQHADSEIADQVFGGVRAAGNLSQREMGQWLYSMTQAGRWNEAYSRWVGSLDLKPGTSLPAIYNGSFETPSPGIGFDWLMRGEPGVQVLRTNATAFHGQWAAKLNFTHRRANNIGFQQYLLLAPGRYRLSFHVRAQDLRSDKGLQWAINCSGQSDPLGTSPPIQGRFDWREMHFEFAVPDTDCPAQHLWLRNPGADGAGKLVAGTLWFDDFQLSPIPTQVD